MYKQKYDKYKQKYNQLKEQYSLKVKDPWLFYMQTGKKTVEGRIGDENKFKDWIGKKVYFMNFERKFPVKVIAIRHYDDLYKYLDVEGFDKVLPGIKSHKEAVNIYHQFYDDDLIKKLGGMNAIEIELI